MLLFQMYTIIIYYQYNYSLCEIMLLITRTSSIKRLDIFLLIWFLYNTRKATKFICLAESSTFFYRFHWL